MIDTTAAGYRFWTDEIVRFADLDTLNHVNNNAIGTYFESARVDLFTRALGAQPGRNGLGVVLASIRIDFRSELHYPARVRVGSKVLRIGRTSVTLGCAIFEGERCIASCEAVCVLLDTATRRPTEVPAPIRAALQEMAG